MTFQEKPKYFTAGPENFGLPTADLVVKRDVKAHGFHDKLGDLSLNFVANVNHDIVIRREKPVKNSAFGWVLPLYAFACSSIIGFPVKLVEIAGYANQFVVELAEGVTEPMTYTIYSWKDLTCMSFEWIGWSSFSGRFPRAVAKMQCGIYAVICSTEDSWKSRQRLRMPVDSSWKMPTVRPSLRIL